MKVIKIAIAIGVLWNIDLWCNGNTADFGSVIRGSNPRGSTNKQFSRMFTISNECRPMLLLNNGESHVKTDQLTIV